MQKAVVGCYETPHVTSSISMWLLGVIAQGVVRHRLSIGVVVVVWHFLFRFIGVISSTQPAKESTACFLSRRQCINLWCLRVQIAMAFANIESASAFLRTRRTSTGTTRTSDYAFFKSAICSSGQFMGGRWAQCRALQLTTAGAAFAAVSSSSSSSAIVSTGSLGT